MQVYILQFGEKSPNCEIKKSQFLFYFLFSMTETSFHKPLMILKNVEEKIVKSHNKVIYEE